jgi:hypothetical protein
MDWLYRADGQPAGPSDHCETRELASDLSHVHLSAVQNCGVAMIVKYALDWENKEKVLGYQIALLDHRVLLEDVKETERLGEDARNKKTTEENKPIEKNEPLL